MSCPDTVHLGRPPRVQTLMQTFMVEETEVGMQSYFQLWDRCIAREMDVLVLEGISGAFLGPAVN
jgi:hypothetical protein